jgi:alkanesulfonate monooxygenase SsuD/methylene tetrahydromethanopterin reductase-like flavin-dependent oxidoreductase (luciferase family)
MKFGLMLGDQPTSVPAAEHFDAMQHQVEAAQRNGFTYIALGQHFLYGGYRWLQPVPVLARLAADTEPHVRLVTAVIVAPLYHPVMLAEELATLDVVTGGRLIVGLGAGYRVAEFESLGVPFDERVSRLEECVELMTQLWSHDRVDFAGRHWSLNAAEPHVQPLQKPRPPLWIGAHSAPGIRRAARIGDAWPVSPRLPHDEIEGRLRTYFRARIEAGLPLGRQPLRREIAIGRDREDALRHFRSMARDRYLGYAAQELATVPSDALGDNFAATAIGHAILGSAAECVEQLRALAARLPVDPIIVRAHWPGMTTQDAVTVIDQIGRDLIPELRDVEPALPPSEP